MNPASTLSDWAGARQSETDLLDWKGIDYRGPKSHQVLMINGTAEDVISFSFYPEEGETTADYTFVVVSSNSEVVDSNTDVSLAQIGSTTQLNITAAVDFNKFPGKAAMTMEARRKADNSLFDSASVDYLAAGLAVFTSETRILISGAGRSFTIPSYKDIYKKPHWEFEAFVQYLNGTNSSELLENLNSSSFFTLSDINTTFISNRGQLLWEDSSCSIADGSWDGAELTLKAGCGIGFAVGFANDTFYDGLHFAFDFEKNRAGRIDTFFEWGQFTADTEFEDEEFTTYILAEIAGQPPAVVQRIEPGNPFSRNGGEEVYVEMINTDDVNLTAFIVNNVPFDLVQGSRQFVAGPADFFETARFVTKPGTGKKLPWIMNGVRDTHSSGFAETEPVIFVDETGFLFSYDDQDIYVFSIAPSTVSENGGDTAILIGNFTTFESNVLDHNVMIGNNVLDNKYVLNSTDEAITFNVPPRAEIGLGWEYDVVIQVGNTYSSPLPLNYEASSVSVSQQTFGTSLDVNSGVYTLSSCGNSTFTAVLKEYNGVEGEYNWRLLNSSNYDLLSLENASSVLKTEGTLVLPNEYIPHYGTLFKVVSNVFVGNISTSSVFLVKRTETVVVGVSLIQPENRTISSPAVNMRVVAKIEIPECYTEPVSLVYEWEYEDKVRTLLQAERLGLLPLSVHNSALEPQFDKYVFSYENVTGTADGKITPTRLGRELIVPREKLQHGVHRVRLKVRAENNSLVGVTATSINILEAPLEAVIGTGQISRRASDAEDMFLSGQGSVDPDVVPPGNPASGLTYQWSCLFSLYSNLSMPQPCEIALLTSNHRNSSIFTVPAESLQNYTKLTLEEDEGQVYIEYKLTVEKDGREGSATQTVAVVRTGGLKLASYERIEVLNSQGEEINPKAVKFWEDIIIRPVTASNTEWRFRLEKPLSEKSQFFTGNAKIIEGPGYYSAMGSSDPGYQRLPLGIRADKLSPHQTYLFSISLQEPGKIADEVYICLRTVEVPALIFPRIAFNNGTVNTAFRATASTSFHGNSSYTFQFYLLEDAKATREYCVDGCTGANTVRFQIAKPGSYIVQCRLLAANGKTLLAVRNNTAVISISPSTSISHVAQFDLDMDRDFVMGDDGSVNQKGFFVTESMHEQDGQVVSMSDDSGSEMCANYTRKWVKRLRAIVGNDLPNTANARNYISLGSNFARLKCVEDAETLYELLAIVEESISRTPPEETLTTVAYSGHDDMPNVQLEEDLLRFYNFTMTRALSQVAAGSSRGRMMPLPGHVNNLVLDLSEVLMKHITAAATSGRVCGWDATYTSSSDDGEPDHNLTPSRSEPPLGVSTIRVAVRCNAEQGTSLSTPFASFEWCDTVYDLSASGRMLITVAESYDYPFLSGIQGLNKSDSRRLVMVDISTLGESNQLVSAMSESMVLAQAESEGKSVDSCYRIGLTMGSEAMTRSDECSENIPYHMWPRKSYAKQFSEQYQNGAYQRRTIGVKVTPETRNDSSVVIAQSNILGLYGASRTTCSSGLFASGITLQGIGLSLAAILIGISLTVLLVSGLTYLLASTLVSRAAGMDEESILIESYVERDFFGRGQVRLNLALDDEGSVTDVDSEYSSMSTIPEGLEGGGQTLQ